MSSMQPGRRAEAGSLPRVSAPALEAAVVDIVRAQVELDAHKHPLADVERVDVSRDSLRVTLKIGDAPRMIDTPIQLKFRNNAMLIQPEGQATTRRGVDRAGARAGTRGRLGGAT
jgi:hypothetical protein